MINRRGALVGLSAAVVAAFGASSSALARMLRWGFAGGQSAISAMQSTGRGEDAVDDRLRKDLARIAPRADSEEGVPVILACENLVTDKTAHQVTPVQLTTLNISLVSEFRRTAEAWERIRPNSPGTHVAKLIQILAYRDFANGGMEQRP